MPDSGDDDDDTNDTQVFMPQNDSYAAARYMRQDMKDKANAQKPKNIVNNNSVAQETSIEEVPTETVQDTQPSELEISYDAASQIIANELYKYITWIIANASEQVDKNGRVKLTGSEKKQVLNVAHDLMSQVTTLPMPKHIGPALHIHKQTKSKELIRTMSKLGDSICYDDT